MYMIHFTPEQYAVFVGGVRCIKKAIKKKRNGRSTRNRKQKKGTRRRQKGGNKVLRTIINGLFLAALFSAYLIYTGTDMTLQTGIIAFSDAANLGATPEIVNEYMEGIAIMVFFSGYNWQVDGRGIPSNCREGVYTPYLPGVGEITSLSIEPIDGWSKNCPQSAVVVGNVLTAVLAGMFMAWVGPCIISELVESTMGPPPTPTPTSTSTSTTPADQSTTSGEEAAQEVLRQALEDAIVRDPNNIDVVRTLQQQQQQIVVSPQKRRWTPEELEEMTRRSEARRMRCEFSNQPLPEQLTPPRRSKGSTSQQLTTSNVQNELYGTQVFIPEPVMKRLKETGQYEAINKMILQAAANIANSDPANQWAEEQEDFFELDPNGRLQLKNTWSNVDLCQLAQMQPGSCPPNPTKVRRRQQIKDRMVNPPSDSPSSRPGRPLIGPGSDSDTDSDNDLTAGGAKRKQTRRRRKRNKKTKKKRPRNKKKGHKRR